MKQKILKLDEMLSVDQMYKATEDKIDKFYKGGKFIEKEKADTMIQDLQMKQDLIMDMLVDKEAIEQQLAAFGSIHFIYVRSSHLTDFLENLQRGARWDQDRDQASPEGEELDLPVSRKPRTWFRQKQEGDWVVRVETQKPNCDS